MCALHDTFVLCFLPSGNQVIPTKEQMEAADIKAREIVAELAANDRMVESERQAQSLAREEAIESVRMCAVCSSLFS